MSGHMRQHTSEQRQQDAQLSDSTGSGANTPTSSITDVVTLSSTMQSSTLQSSTYEIYPQVCILPPLPIPGTPGAPYFQGKDISAFLEIWEMFCEYSCRSPEAKFELLPRYCKWYIGESIKRNQGWIDRDWEALVKWLEEEYKERDTRQKRQTDSFLYQLATAGRDGKVDVQEYVAAYAAYAEPTIKKGKISSREATRLFVGGLPTEYRYAVGKKTNLDDDEPTGGWFEHAYQLYVKKRNQIIALREFEI